MNLNREYTSDEYTGPVVEDCWVVLMSRGLSVQWDTGDGFVDYAYIHASDIVEGAQSPDIEEYEDDPQDMDSETAAIFDDWLCEPGRIYEFFGVTIKAAAVPCCDLDEEDGFKTLRHSMRDRMMHDPNFHSGLYGASREDRWRVASDLCGIEWNDSDEEGNSEK